jgi:hypothetical protein
MQLKALYNALIPPAALLSSQYNLSVLGNIFKQPYY